MLDIMHSILLSRSNEQDWCSKSMFHLIETIFDDFCIIKNWQRYGAWDADPCQMKDRQAAVHLLAEFTAGFCICEITRLNEDLTYQLQSLKKRVHQEQRSQWKPSKNASKTCKFVFACPCCKGQKSKPLEIRTLGSAFKPFWLAGGMLSKRTILPAMHEAQSCLVA